jgi:hypothetical protein
MKRLPRWVRTVVAGGTFAFVTLVLASPAMAEPATTAAYPGRGGRDSVLRSGV